MLSGCFAHLQHKLRSVKISIVVLYCFNEVSELRGEMEFNKEKGHRVDGFIRFLSGAENHIRSLFREYGADDIQSS